MRPTLYSYYRSSCSWRVRIALALKGIDYEYKGVDLISDGGQQLSPKYKAINPFNQVPALVVRDESGNGVTLVQSLPIIDYLEVMKPDPPLLPSDGLKKCQVKAIAECINSGIQPLQNLNIFKYVEDIGGDKLVYAKYIIADRLVALETMLAPSAGKYCFGDDITLADVCLIPQVYNAKRYGVEMDKFPIISRICVELEKLPAFIATHPDKQPDSPVN